MYILVFLLVLVPSPLAMDTGPPQITIVHVLTTGYCSGLGLKCGIHPRWDDGITASGTHVQRGSCAADRREFNSGTRFKIPGYGLCRVEDTGNGVRGYHLDLYFDTYQEAIQWGRRYLDVEVISGSDE